MHELSIAARLVETAEVAVREAGVCRVNCVHLRLGTFAGVVKDSLLFAYDVVTEGTLLEGSRLDIEDVPLVIYCRVCEQEASLPTIQLFECPTCGMPTTDIRQGKELELVSVEVIDD